MSLVLRKLLATSTFAIAGALNSMADRVRVKLTPKVQVAPLEDQFGEDYESLDETADELFPTNFPRQSAPPWPSVTCG